MKGCGLSLARLNLNNIFGPNPKTSGFQSIASVGAAYSREIK
jgi:hypothetical protein